MKNTVLLLSAIIFFTSCAKDLPYWLHTGKPNPTQPIQVDTVKTLYLTTTGDISSKDDYIDATIRIDTTTYKTEIKGRGNSTWAKPKNPYKLKLDKKASLMGMPSNNEWALLANWFDPSSLREDLGRHLGEVLDNGWTPRRRFVEVVWNGTYHGLYLLSELVEASKDRLNTKWIVEGNWRQDEKINWVTNSSVRLSAKDPEQPKNIEQIKAQFQAWEDATSAGTYGETDFTNLVNQDAIIKWTIMQEVMRNRDGIFFGSCFFYQDSLGRIALGAPWDFDLSAGSYDGSVPEGWYVNYSNIIGNMFRYNKPYRKRYKEIWNQYKPQILASIGYPALISSYLGKAQQRNYDRWIVLQKKFAYPGQELRMTLNEEISALQNFLSARINWMDKEIQKF